MGDILDLAVGDFITAKVYTYHLNNIDEEFTNTYEFRINAIGIGLSDLEVLAQALGTYHKKIHHNDCWIDRVVISTYEAEEGGYDPLSFVIFPQGYAGERTISGDALSADLVAYVKRVVDVGRTGKLHFRLSLAEGDINAPSGKVRLASPGTIGSEFEAFIEGSGMDAYLSNYGASSIQMAMISEVGEPPVTVARFVRDLVLSGVRDTNPNHRYFDRA